jgi:N-acetylmuramic acid 6-phosphate etherase
MNNRGHLSTERHNPESENLDMLATLDAVDLFAAEDRRAVEAVAAAREEIAYAIDLIAYQLAHGGRLFYVGAGTSGRLGVLDASELPPTFQTAPQQTQALIAGGIQALTNAIEGAEDSAEQGSVDLAACNPTPQDAVLGISAGGTTAYVRGALTAARNGGAKTLFLACVPRTEVEDAWDHSIRIVTGPEILAGSTRLKAGTATKLVLNTISTMVQVRLGRVHGNRMVDLNTTANHKLVDRAIRIVEDLACVDRDRATSLLHEASGRVKIAVLLGAKGVTLTGAEVALATARGNLRQALANG